MHSSLFRGTIPTVRLRGAERVALETGFVDGSQSAKWKARRELSSRNLASVFGAASANGVTQSKERSYERVHVQMSNRAMAAGEEGLGTQREAGRETI